MPRVTTKPCRVEGCHRSGGRRGYCLMHYKRVMRNGTPYRHRPVDVREGEGWVPIPGLEGRYEASTHGRLRWVGPVIGRAYPGKVIAGHANQDGYRQLRPYPRPNRRPVRVHQLIALAFLGPCPDGCEVNHIDGNRENNAPWNLEYVTHADNIRHTWALGNIRRDGEFNGRARLTPDDVRSIRKRAAAGASQRKLAREFGVGQTAISRIVQRKSWRNVY